MLFTVLVTFVSHVRFTTLCTNSQFISKYPYHTYCFSFKLICIKPFNNIAVAAEYAYWYKFIVMDTFPSNCNCLLVHHYICYVHDSTHYSVWWSFFVLEAMVLW